MNSTTEAGGSETMGGWAVHDQHQVVRGNAWQQAGEWGIADSAFSFEIQCLEGKGEGGKLPQAAKCLLCTANSGVFMGFPVVPPPPSSTCFLCSSKESTALIMSYKRYEKRDQERDSSRQQQQYQLLCQTV